MRLVEGCHGATVATPNEGSARSSIDLQRLAGLDRTRLRQLWHKYCEGPVPPKVSRRLLTFYLAYRIQEQAYGGLSAASRARLRNIAQQLESAPIQRSGLRLTPGTRLIRQWREQRHEVTVLEHGFAYRGRHYGSLSAIARVISGSQCSGPRFFGLRPAAPAALERGAES